MAFSMRRRQSDFMPLRASVWTNHAVEEVMRLMATALSTMPVDFTGLMSLLLVPARCTDFSRTSACMMLAGEITSCRGVRRIFLPRESWAWRMVIRACSSDVCDNAAGVNRFDCTPPITGCDAEIRAAPSPPWYRALNARFRWLAWTVSSVSVID